MQKDCYYHHPFDVAHLARPSSLLFQICQCPNNGRVNEVDFGDAIRICNEFDGLKILLLPVNLIVDFVPHSESFQFVKNWWMVVVHRNGNLFEHIAD
jgi:hypothetical protein